MPPQDTKPSDPADPSNANSDHTTKDGEKPQSAITAITDPDFIPTLENAPPNRYLQSFIVLSTMTGALAFGAWYLDFDIFQSSLQQGLILGAVVMAFFYTGIVWIDWWEVVVKYWWLSLPVLAGAGLVVVRMDEATKALDEVD